MGTRYSRLLQLLWRKPSRRISPSHDMSLDLGSPMAMHSNVKNNSFSNNVLTHSESFENTGYGTSMVMPSLAENEHMDLPPATGTFSWLDLGAAWSFATHNNKSVGGGSAGEFDNEQTMGDSGLSPSDMGLMGDYSLLSEDNPSLIF